MANKPLKVDTHIFRRFLNPHITNSGFYGDFNTPVGYTNGQYVDPACDEFGRQYVVSMRDEDREFSQRSILNVRGVGVAFLGHRLVIDQLFGFNAHPTNVLFVQLWQTGSGHDWRVNGEIVSQVNNMVLQADSPGSVKPKLITSWPVQPNYGTFSLDGPILLRNGLSIAISATPGESNWTSPGSHLWATLIGRERETGIEIDNDVNI